MQIQADMELTCSNWNFVFQPTFHFKKVSSRKYGNRLPGENIYKKHPRLSLSTNNQRLNKDAGYLILTQGIQGLANHCPSSDVILALAFKDVTLSGISLESGSQAAVHRA